MKRTVAIALAALSLAGAAPAAADAFTYGTGHVAQLEQPNSYGTG